MDDAFISYHTRTDGERYFTNADMAQMVEAGLIDPDDRWELIRGAWFGEPTEAFDHMRLRSNMLQKVILQLRGGDDVKITSKGSFLLFDDTDLSPDLIIYRADVGTNEMTGADIFLVIEVMKSSQRRDMQLKRPVYAAAGVPELWLIDLDAARVHVFRQPDTEAETYADTAEHGPDASLSPEAFPNLSLSLNDLRPKT